MSTLTEDEKYGINTDDQATVDRLVAERLSMHTEDKKTYAMAAVCSNCGWSGTFRVPKGHTLSSVRECPNCGCTRLMGMGDPAFKKATL